MSDKKAEELNKETEDFQENEALSEDELENTIGNEIDEVEHKVLELEKEVSTLKDMHLRKVAELENMRKRIQRERLQIFEDAKAGALEDFLPISDDLKRTLEAADGMDIDKNFLAGVDMVNKKFQEVLNRYGVERIDETNVPFDVDLHDAMMKQPAPNDTTGSDVVLQVLESGYRIGNRTIRHAKVIVSE